MKKFSSLLIIFFILIVLPFTLQRCDFSKNEKTAKIEQLIDYCYNNGIFNGTILVAEHGKVIYNKAKGFANFETKERLNTDSPFYLASVTKQFTAMAIMMLYEQGKLNYNDQLTKYFPEFPDYAQKVTIRNMLNHTSGIADHFELGLYKPGLTNKEVFDALVQRKALDFEPNSRYSYSNGNYVLLSLIVEKISGQPFSLFMKNHIFDPLNMDHTLVYDESKPEIPNRAIGYDMLGNVADYDILTTGAGGIYSTTEDLFKWDQALYTDQLVSQKTLEEAFTPARLADGTSTGYGFGWGITETTTDKIISHGGGLGGFRTYIERQPKHKNTIIILSNIGDATPVSDISREIRNILNDQEMQYPKIPISLKIYNIIKESGIDMAIEKYGILRTNELSRYDFSEEQLNQLGYYFLHRDMMDKAIAIFKLNVKEFPNSSNVFDSLGEAYLKIKNYELASENYEKSLALDPQNNNAVEMLNKIAREKVRPNEN